MTETREALLSRLVHALNTIEPHDIYEFGKIDAGAVCEVPIDTVLDALDAIKRYSRIVAELEKWRESVKYGGPSVHVADTITAILEGKR